jgi:hypothetical protein
MSKLYMKSTSLIAPAVCTTDNAATSAVVDLSDYPEGDLVLEMHATKAVAESGDSMSALWMESDAEEGPFADSGLVFPAVGESANVLHQVVLDRSERKQFGYFAGNVSGSTPEIGLAVSLTAYQRLAS